MTGNNKNKILIVEDAPTQRAILCNLIKELGLTPICPTFFDSSVISYISDNEISLVLLDLILLDSDGHPIGDGFQICNEIKSYDPEVKVIIISAETDQAAQEFATSQGADGFISKPFKTAELEECLKLNGIL